MGVYLSSNMSDTLGFIEEHKLAEQLAAFNLNAVEAKIYLHLVNKQPKSILQIARELDLPRTSVYDNAVKLAEKGLVQQIVTFKSQQLQANPVNILQAVIDKEKSRVEVFHKNLAALQDHISHALIPPVNTEVRHYNGAKGFQQMLWNTLRAKNETI